MMKRIIYTRADGGVAVLTPAEGARLAFRVSLADGTVLEKILQARPTMQPVDVFLRGWPVEGATASWAESEEEFVARIGKKDVPRDASDVQVVDADAIPADRTYRNAWRTGVGCIDHDMGKCREIHKDLLRALRKPKLEALDADYMRADERGDATEKQRIAERKQALRDVTADPRIAAAATPEALKAVIPEALQQA